MPSSTAPTRANWLTARARNALRRGTLLGAVGGIGFLVALITLALVPRGAAREARRIQLRAGAPIDTVPLLAAHARDSAAIAAAEAALGAVRAAITRRAQEQAALDSARRASAALLALGDDPASRRDSLQLVVGTLTELLGRVENAPLPTSYRALGESWALRGEPRAAALLDSLAALERERAGFDAVGSVDPAYIALTTRVNDVGRELTQLGTRRRAEARAALAAIAALSRPAAATVASADDTTPRLAAIEAARARLAENRLALFRARRHNAGVAEGTARAQRLSRVVPPPAALVAAAVVLGVALAFLVSLLVEMRHPRLTDAAEAERVTGARVLAVVEPPDTSPDRVRRRTDRDAPPLLDPTFESYRLLYLQVAATGAAIPLVSVTGDEPEVTAVVAANLAAASAFDARGTLLVDADLAHGLVCRVLRVPREPGLAGIVTDDEEWARAIVSTPVGRSRYLDVITSGRTGRVGAVSEDDAERVRRDLARYAARYDLAVLVAPTDLAEQGGRALLPAPDVVLCARVGHTPLARLAEAAEALRGAGTRLRGVVVWRADPPQIMPRGEADAPRRDMSWTETRQAVAAR